jgi:hypothetical protein
MFAIEAGDFARRLAIDGTLFQIRPPITSDFPLPHAAV